MEEKSQSEEEDEWTQEAKGLNQAEWKSNLPGSYPGAQACNSKEAATLAGDWPSRMEEQVGRKTSAHSCTQGGAKTAEWRKAGPPGRGKMGKKKS